MEYMKVLRDPRELSKPKTFSREPPLIDFSRVGVFQLQGGYELKVVTEGKLVVKVDLVDPEGFIVQKGLRMIKGISSTLKDPSVHWSTKVTFEFGGRFSEEVKTLVSATQR